MNRAQLNRLRHNQNVEVNTIDKLCNILNCKVEEIMTHYADDNVFWNMKKEPTILVDYWLLSFLYSVSFIYLYDRFPSSANFLLQFQSAPHCMAAVNGSTAWIYQSGRSCPRICFFLSYGRAEDIFCWNLPGVFLTPHYKYKCLLHLRIH